MDKFITKRLLILIIIVAISFTLRFVQLGINPPSLDWDEASLGYNAYSILKTGNDEYGNFLPLSIRSFDDYKPPLYVYLAIPSIALFGLTEFAVRVPSALLGSLSVLLTYLLVKELFKRFQNRELIALLSAFLMGISPWSLQFSRAAFEGNIGLFFFLGGLFFYLKGIEYGKWFIVSAIFFVMSIYSYHSFRLVAPLLVLCMSILFYKELLKQKLYIVLGLLVFFILTVPVWQSFVQSGSSASRLSMVSTFDKLDDLNRSIKRLEVDIKNDDVIGTFFHNRRFVYSMQVVRGYLDHFDPKFLFLYGDGGRQHHAVEMGMVYLFELPFIVIGIIFLTRYFNRYIAVLFLSFFLAPVAAALTTGTPHPVRAIAMIPFLHVFTAFGIAIVYEYIVRQKNYILKLSAFSVLTILFVLNIVYYFHQYYIHTPFEYGDFWQYGYKEVFHKTKQVESEYKKIIVTYVYDQPYIYYLFYNKIDPAWYQENWDYNKNGQIDRFKRVIGKYEFRNVDWNKDRENANTIVVGTPNEIPSKLIHKVEDIFFLDKTVAFKIVYL